MKVGQTCLRWLLAFSLLAFLAAPALSQTSTTGAITGRAQDASGALIPGVEVTITSPSMIGGARSATTDEQGSYRFTLLAPGVYRVSFALSGFKTLNLDAVDVIAGNTRTINGTMEVAAMAEEVTVTSAAPTIDLEAATVGVNWSLQKLDNLPYSRSLAGFTTMIPGLFQTRYDVGGSSFATGSNVSVRNYGRSGNSVVAIDGLIWDQGYADWGAFEEANVTTASKGADQMNSGVTVNLLLKSGGNDFHGSFTGDLEKGNFQSTNVDDNLRKRGYQVGSNKFTHLRDIYGDVGGPVMKDRLWFYVSYRDGYSGNFIPGFVYLKDGSPGIFNSTLQSPTAKLTYQLTNSMKIDTSWQLGRKWQPYRTAAKYVPVEASQNQDSWSTFGPNLKLTDIVSPKMTITAGINRGGYWWPDYPWTEGCKPGPGCTDTNAVRKEDTRSGSGARLGPILRIYRRPIRWTWNGDVSYFNDIGGKNNELKFGYYGWWDKGYTTNFGYPNQQIYRYLSTSADDFTESTPDRIRNLFRNPNSVQILDYPNTVASRGGYKAFYVNDKITWNRKLTINAGFRFDRFDSFLPKQGSKGENPFFPVAVPYAERHDFPVYTKIVPRLSLAYDISGTGKLAFKAGFGRYTDSSSSPSSQPGPGASDVNPNSTTTCTYNNWNGVIPFTPGAGRDGRLFTSDDTGATFAGCTGGGGSFGTRRIDTNLKANYLDEYNAGIEVGFSRDVTLRFNFVRKFHFRKSKLLNLAEPFEAWTDLATVVDWGPDNTLGTADDGRVYAWSVPRSYPTQGQINTFITNTRPGEGKSQWVAYEATLNKNFSNKWSFLGSYVIDMGHENPMDPINPNEALYHCSLLPGDNNPTCYTPSRWSQALKTSGQYQLPWGVMWSSTYTAQSGNWYNRRVQIRNTLGTNVTQTVQTNVGRYPWVNLWDNRISKSFRIGERQTIEANFDLFNTLNVNTVTSQNDQSNQLPNAQGPVYGRPSEIISPRIFKLGFRYRF